MTLLAADAPPPVRVSLARALLLSLGVHLALLALVTPPSGTREAQIVVIQARLAAPPPPLAPRQATLPAVPPPERDAHLLPPPAPASAPLETPTPPLQPEVPRPIPETVAAATATPQEVDREATPSRLPPADARAAAATPSTPATPSADPAPALPAPVDATWYQARQVDRPARALGEIRPDYPDAARRRGQEGSLKVMVRIDDLGRVAQVEVVEAVPPGVFDESALAALRQARFQPALRQGRPVRFEAYLRVDFRLE